MTTMNMQYRWSRMSYSNHSCCRFRWHSHSHYSHLHHRHHGPFSSSFSSFWTSKRWIQQYISSLSHSRRTHTLLRSFCCESVSASPLIVKWISGTLAMVWDSYLRTHVSCSNGWVHFSLLLERFRSEDKLDFLLAFFYILREVDGNFTDHSLVSSLANFGLSNQSKRRFVYVCGCVCLCEKSNQRSLVIKSYFG